MKGPLEDVVGENKLFWGRSEVAAQNVLTHVGTTGLQDRAKYFRSMEYVKHNGNDDDDGW